jgi:tungstate transport system ATP-binding protein
MDSVIPGKILTNRDGALIVSVPEGVVEAIGEPLPGEKVYCGIRPENVGIDITNPEQSIHGQNVFPARITTITSIGPFLKVTMDCGFPLVSYVTRESFTRLKLAVGEKVVASFKATAVHLISKKK